MQDRIESPLLPHIQSYVGGRWVDADSDARVAVYDPATGALLAQVPSLSRTQVEEAVEVARRALHPTPSFADRKRWLAGIADALKKNAKELGRIVTLEHGKPWKEGQAEVEYAAGFFRFCADNLDAIAPRKLDNVARGGTWVVQKRPAGVVGLISPWNFPIAMIAKKLSTAIAAGCPSLTKPASKTPLSMIALFTLMDRELDMPPGYVNLVMGSSSTIGKVLCEHPHVPVISFTGSTEVGKQLIDMTKDRVKRLSLELGGNAPYVVFADADLSAAADHLIANKFRGAGQTCVCTNRVLVQREVAEEFARLVAERTAKLKVGNGLEPDTDIGPLIDRAGWEKVRDHVADALAHGAEKVYGPEPREPEGDVKAFFPPTVLRKVTPAMACWREETFGPLVPLVDFATEEEAIELANNTQYGLASYVFTRDDARAERVIERLQFGHVGWNTGTGPTPEAPFGGVKESGYGREGGIEGLHEFIEVQTVARP